MALVYTLYSEKDRRLYAAAEAIKLGYGGNSYISRVLGCDRKTILQGILELNHPELIEKDRLRTKGGGRKTSLESISDLDVNFLEVIFFYTAGDPMDDKVRWTHLTYAVQIDQNSCSTMAPCKGFQVDFKRAKNGWTFTRWIAALSATPTSMIFCVCLRKAYYHRRFPSFLHLLFCYN